MCDLRCSAHTYATAGSGMLAATAYGQSPSYDINTYIHVYIYIYIERYVDSLS